MSRACYFELSHRSKISLGYSRNSTLTQIPLFSATAKAGINLEQSEQQEEDGPAESVDGIYLNLLSITQRLYQLVFISVLYVCLSAEDLYVRDSNVNERNFVLLKQFAIIELAPEQEHLMTTSRLRVFWRKCHKLDKKMPPNCATQ